MLCGVKSAGQVKLKRCSVPSGRFWGSCHQLDGEKPGLEGRTHPEVVDMTKASALPKAEPRGKGRCGSYVAPKSTRLGDDAGRVLAMTESVNSIPSPSLSRLVKDPEVPISQLLGTQLSALLLIQFC